jgi:hypothetical protein
VDPAGIKSLIADFVGFHFGEELTLSPSGVTSLSGHTTVMISATAMPIDTSANR